jgi:branched-chain amino acid transport system permease protein
MRARRALAAAAALGLAVLLPLAAAVLDQPFYVGFATRLMVYAIAATSLDLALGYCGLVSFGHAAFVGVGAYTVAILAAQVPSAGAVAGLWHGMRSLWLAWPAAILASAGAAALVGYVSLRTRGIQFIMITLAFAQMLYYFMVSLKDYGGDDGLTLARRSDPGMGLSLANDAALYYVVLAILCAVLALLAILAESRFGRAIAGIRENETRMEAIGYPTFRYKWACFTLAGALGGLAGALLVNQNGFVSPNALHWSQSGELLVMVLLGGKGRVYGGLLGAVVLLGLEEALSGFTTHWRLPVGMILLAVAYFAPGGLAGLGRRAAAR